MIWGGVECLSEFQFLVVDAKGGTNSDQEAHAGRYQKTGSRLLDCPLSTKMHCVWRWASSLGHAGSTRRRCSYWLAGSRRPAQVWGPAG